MTTNVCHSNTDIECQHEGEEEGKMLEILWGVKPPRYRIMGKTRKSSLLAITARRFRVSVYTAKGKIIGMTRWKGETCVDEQSSRSLIDDHLSMQSIRYLLQQLCCSNFSNKLSTRLSLQPGSVSSPTTMWWDDETCPHNQSRYPLSLQTV